MRKISVADVLSAQKTVAPYVRRTQFAELSCLSKKLATQVFIKYENQQVTGSFKPRGAINKILHLNDDEKSRGVVACSAGNHAQGVAWAASLIGTTCHVVMPETASQVKVIGTQNLGAQVIQKGEFFDQAVEHARQLERDRHYTFVHPFEDEFIIAGQGTIGLEILEETADLDTLIVPVGGGGLIGGIATVIKERQPRCKIIGVQAERAQSMFDLFQRQPHLQRSGLTLNTIADGIAMKVPSQVMYQNYISRLVDHMVTVTEDQIAEAIVYMLEGAKMVVEGAGAVGIAAALAGKIDLGSKCCFVVSGGNIDMNIVSKVIENGLAHRGRLCNLSVVIDDLPGNLNRLTQVLAEKRANILQIYHDRVSHYLFLRETKVDFLLETIGFEHIESIRKALIAIGARIL